MHVGGTQGKDRPMYTIQRLVYIRQKRCPMRSTVSNIRNKHLRLNQTKIERARKVLGARTDTETIEQALDLVLEEHARNKAALTAHTRFVKGIAEGVGEIRDVFGALDLDR